ncbi:MAG: aminopeptidase [Nitrososphaerales archaeon]
MSKSLNMRDHPINRNSRENGSFYRKPAKSLIEDVLGIRRGESLTIEAWQHDEVFAKEAKIHAQKLGARVILVLEDDESYFKLAESPHAENAGKVGKHEWALLENSDAYLFFPGPADAERQDRLDKRARSKAQAYNNEWYRRASNHHVRGARVRSSYVTKSRARLLGLDYERWLRNTIDAIQVDYKEIDKVGKKIAKLVSGESLSITGPGTNLELKSSRKPAHLYSGLMRHPPRYSIYSAMMSIPGSEIDFVPIPNSANGHITFDRPSLFDSKRLEGLKLSFANGKLNSYSATQNLSLFSKPYKAAVGDKDKIGAISIGLNPKLSYGFNQDFHVSGAITVGLGSLGEGDNNKTEFSFIATLSKATVKAGKKIIIENGKILIS